MNAATKRAILRWVHLVLTIPVLGYIYSPPELVKDYADGVRFIFVPVMILSGFWMYAGVVFAIIAVALWVGSFYLSGFGTALLSQIALLIAWKIWSVVKARRAKQAGLA